MNRSCVRIESIGPTNDSLYRIESIQFERSSELFLCPLDSIRFNSRIGNWEIQEFGCTYIQGIHIQRVYVYIYEYIQVYEYTYTYMQVLYIYPGYSYITCEFEYGYELICTATHAATHTATHTATCEAFICNVRKNI